MVDGSTLADDGSTFAHARWLLAVSAQTMVVLLRSIAVSSRALDGLCSTLADNGSTLEVDGSRTLSSMGLTLRFLAHSAIVDGLRCCRKLSATGPREGPLRIQRWPMVSTSTDALGICPTLVQVLCAFSDGPCSDVAGCSWQLAPHKDQRWSIVAMMPDALNKRPLAKFLCAFGNGQWF